jgi:hypothetical protein
MKAMMLMQQQMVHNSKPLAIHAHLKTFQTTPQSSWTVKTKR